MTDSNVARVNAIRDSLPPSLAWTEADLAILALAHAQARDVDALERRDDLAAMRERRFARLALIRAIGQLDLPDHARSSVLKAQKAAQTRWKAG